MLKESYHIIGVMSGTSLDGIDLAEINFTKNETWQFQILKATTVHYTEEWLSKLKSLTQKSKKDLQQIDLDYTNYLADVITTFVKKNNIKNIDAVCSHGHTALHQPEQKLTYQIGNLPELAKKINQNVVCDFRVQDVEFGGQGAPLVPIGDELLFSEYDYCINLGGFANVSTKIKNQRIAFDICPVNIVLNKYVQQLGLGFDDKGYLASQGKINQQLLEQLNALNFYKKSYPKSLGLEWVEEQIFPLIDKYDLTIKDILRIMVEHVAQQIAKVISQKVNVSVLLTGGGTYNDFLVERIKALTNNKIVIPSKEIIEFKEALIFGFLGVLKLRDENNCLASVTGANKDHSSGNIFKI
ncbi:anhydro-N-acetylmuramic acid kinase [Mesoflavibacter sp. CH_XMU1404-2]|uniref:anhydro-N-acetylmuramic acid kinase n=1 Tax=Mesoflavibacter sp. CH_XMU1404-2 TaxID=3107766 RepID=UPI00300B86CA